MDISRMVHSSQDQESLCIVCEAIDWSDIIRRTYNVGSFFVQVRRFSPSDTYRKLQLSTCPICRAIATVTPRTMIDKARKYTLVSRWAPLVKEYKGGCDSGVILSVDGGSPSPFWSYYGFLTLFDSRTGNPHSTNIPQHPVAASPGRSPTISPDFGPIHKIQLPESILSRDGDNISLHLRGDRPDFAYIKMVEKICRSIHPGCQDSWVSMTDLGLRVIDCHTKRVIDAPVDSKYVALSYVWGDVASTLDPQSKEPTFPPVVRDSIEVALGLHYSYLWVDRHVRPILLHRCGSRSLT